MRAERANLLLFDGAAIDPDAGLLRKLRIASAALAGGIGLGLLLGNAWLGLAAILALGFALALWWAPLRLTTLALFFVALLANSPKERPADGIWHSPLTFLGDLLYENLNNLTGISALRFAGIELALAAFLVAIAARRLFRPPEDRPGAGRPLGVSSIVGLSLFAIFALEGMGLATGGDFKASLWQIREPLWLPILVWLFQAAEIGLEDLPVIAVLIVLAAVLKTAEGFYVYQFIAKPQGIRLPYVTTHSDTQLFVTATLILVIGWMFSRARTRWLLMALALVPLLGIFLNNRRLAYVSLGANLLLLYAALPRSKVKRDLTRIALFGIPLAAIYVAVGWGSSSPFFAPVHTLTTIVVSRDDASTGTRDIENYNLIQTLKVHPIQGWGFGHPYLELSKAYDISSVFSLYRYVGHNSVLWLWSVGGLLGFSAIWLPLILAVFFSARCAAFARSNFARAGSLVALTVPVTCMLQAYGDMGLQSWNGAFLLAATLAAMSRAAVELGVWPEALPRLGRPIPGQGVPAAT